MKNTFLAIAALATLFSCSSIDEIAGDKYAAGDYVESVEMTVEDFEEDATTRTALSNLSDSGAKFAWAENDTVGIFPNVGDQVSFSMAAGAGTSSATFNGGGWALRTSSSYSAYYPFSRANFYRDSKTIAINMVGQSQDGNDATSEIGKYDIMAAAPASAETGNVKFAFKHQVSICRIKLTLPENKSFRSVKVISGNKQFITKATMDISGSMPAITATETSEEISLSLKNFSTTSTNRELVANMYVLPVDMSSDKLTVEVTDVDGNVYTDVNATGVNFEKAKIRILNATPLASGVDGEGEGEDFTGDEITQPLTFTNDNHGFGISLANHGGNAPYLEYSLDGGPWIPWDYSYIYVSQGQKLNFRGDNPSGFSKDYNKYSNFEITWSSDLKVDGNIMSIVTKNNFSSLKTISANYCFYSLFREIGLIKGPLLPATTLAGWNCYASMFSGCTSLTKAPALPATTLVSSCYEGMFSGCTRLTQAPVLPATTLAYGCYDRMFSGCTSLTSAPKLPATSLDNVCYNSMFEGCASLTQAPALPATTLADECYRAMFKGCTSLTQAPVLPATTLATSCYISMFSGCTSLKQAPTLPAITLAESCYHSMFAGCTSLSTVKAAFTTIPYSYSIYGWLYGVSPAGTFFKNKNATWNDEGVVPSGWNVVLYDTDANKCEIEGHEYVDLGLSVKWATCNVGSDKPEDYGGYYAWGETTTKSRYDWDNCFDCLDGSGDSWNIYKIGGKTKIEPNSGHDTARENWGGTWRMPTEAELQELNDRCTWTWTSKGGHNGYIVIGPNGNSIFLPAADCRLGDSTCDMFGTYWSSTLCSNSSSAAAVLSFGAAGHIAYYDSRNYGLSVRPVTE